MTKKNRPALNFAWWLLRAAGAYFFLLFTQVTFCTSHRKLKRQPKKTELGSSQQGDSPSRRKYQSLGPGPQQNMPPDNLYSSLGVGDKNDQRVNMEMLI